jgi:hypothetical protein
MGEIPNRNVIGLSSHLFLVFLCAFVFVILCALLYLWFVFVVEVSKGGTEKGWERKFKTQM